MGNQDQLLFQRDGGPGSDGPVECLGLAFDSDDERRAYFTELLREKLRDPEFRAIEGFPIGEDEAILALSDPPYHTACPNPWVADFVARYGKPYHMDSDAYEREPFAADVSEGKNDPIYNAHSYHTKVPHKAIMRYILHYTDPGDVVVDCFAGSGMTGVAARMCADPPPDLRAIVEADWLRAFGKAAPWGPRHVVLNDLSPAATFITNGFTSAWMPQHVQKELEAALDSAAEGWGWCFRTAHNGWPAGERNPARWVNRDHSAGEGRVICTIWSEVLTCPHCSSELVVWPEGIDPERAAIKDTLVCSSCGAAERKAAWPRREETVWDRAVGGTVTRNKCVPAFIVYEFGGRRFEKLADDSDVALVKQTDEAGAVNRGPVAPMMGTPGRWGNLYRAGYHKGVSHAHHFFTTRNWVVFGQLWNSTESPQGRFVLTSLLNRLSRMSSLHMKNFFRGGGGFVAGNTKGNLYFPSVWIEQSPFVYFEERLKRVLGAMRKMPACIPHAVATASAAHLGLPDASVDYAFVDPPFGQNLIYSELSFLWEAWLRVTTDVSSEAIIDSYRHKDHSAYQQSMEASFRELHRVLKPGRWLTVEFHNSQNSVWMAIQEALSRSGFVVADVRVLDKQQGSHKQNVAAGAVKQDLVISAYKPRADLEADFRITAGSAEGAWCFIRGHLRQLPVTVETGADLEVVAERQAYLLYDRMVAFHVQRSVNVPLSAAEFYAGLDSRFPTRDGMYFLPEQVAEYDRKRLQVQDVRQLELFVTDEESAIQWLRQTLSDRPMSYQDLSPLFMREIAGWERHEKALELSELLDENFIVYDGKGDVPSQIHAYLSSNFREMRVLDKTDSRLRVKARNRWYVPDPRKAGDLEQLRERTLLKEFDDYASGNGKLKVFRVEAIRAGFKRAWQEHDYATIISVAERLPADVLQEDAKLLMWYDQALTRVGE